MLHDCGGLMGSVAGGSSVGRPGIPLGSVAFSIFLLQSKLTPPSPVTRTRNTLNQYTNSTIGQELNQREESMKSAKKVSSGNT